MPQSESVITLTAADATVAAAEVRPQRSDRSTMLNGSAVMLVAMMLVNIFNFAYNMVMARMLGPGAFGNINAAVTLLLLASCISLAFQLVAPSLSPEIMPTPARPRWSTTCLAKPGWPVLLWAVYFSWRRNQLQPT